MTDDNKFDAGLQELLNSVAKDSVDRDGAFCTNYIVVAEFMDSNGQYWSMVHKNEELPIWRHTGLLQYVLENSLNDEEESEENYG